MFCFFLLSNDLKNASRHSVTFCTPLTKIPVTPGCSARLEYQDLIRIRTDYIKPFVIYRVTTNVTSGQEIVTRTSFYWKRGAAGHAERTLSKPVRVRFKSDA